jgi:hypothetical protein
MEKATVEFVFEKENKNSVRYKEVPEPGKAEVLGSIYVQKWFAEGAKSLTLTLEKNSVNNDK